jgi:hypothetical protein
MALETCRSHIHSNLNFDQNEIYFKKILIPFFYPVVFSYCIGSGYILLEVISVLLFQLDKKSAILTERELLC